MPDMDFVGGVYLYRHPVDVFLSALNYMFINSNKQPGFAKYFDGRPQSIDDLASSGRLTRYLERFVEDRGMTPMRWTSGTWVDNVNCWMAAENTADILLVSYNALISDLKGSMQAIIHHSAVDVSEEGIDLGIKSAIAATKRDGGFFWRASANTRFEFFSSAEVDAAEAALYPSLAFAEKFSVL